VSELDTLATGLNDLPESLRNYAARRLVGPIRIGRIAWDRLPLTLHKHSIAQRFCPILADAGNAKSRDFTGKTQLYVAESSGGARLRIRCPGPLDEGGKWLLKSYSIMV